VTPFNIRKLVKKLLGIDKSGDDPSSKPAARYSVTFELPDGSSYAIKARHEDSLVLASGRGAHPIATGCSDGTCGTCRVVVLEGGDQLTPATEHEARARRANGVPETERLGCQTLVLGEGVRVRIVNVLGEELVD
jgi:ferredoxin